MSAGAGLRFKVRIDDPVLAEDLPRCSKAGQRAIESTFDEVRKGGAPREWLLRCEEEGRDGTRLGGCVKFYIPRPAGQWGAVLAADQQNTKPALVLIAVGERHPERPWRQSVYEVAHRRLHR